MSAPLDLRLGDWRDVLADVECDALICDPPFGLRTHAGHDNGVRIAREYVSGSGTPTHRRALDYGAWTADDVSEFVQHWSPRTRGWFCAFSCSNLFPAWQAALEDTGRYAFAPVVCIIRAMGVRLSGDGPSSWTVYLNVARPRRAPYSRWGARNGAYVVDRAPAYIGGKPLELMAAIIRDYTRPGDLVCDPCAGMVTTGIAALAARRRFVGAEVDPTTHAAALERVRRGVQQEMLA